MLEKATRSFRVSRRHMLLGAAALGASAALPRLVWAETGEAAFGVTKRSYVDGRFGQIHVYTATPPGGLEAATQTPLMCFHPTAASGDYFRDFIAEMGRDRIAMAMDTPGYGRSDRPPEPQMMAELAGAAADGLDALGYGENGAGPVDVIGYHTGCFICTELAIQRPDLVRRLALPGIPYNEGEARTEALERNGKPKPITEDGVHLEELWKFWVTNRQKGVTLERGAEHFADEMQAVPYQHWAYIAVFSYEAEKRLPLVTQPVVVLNTHGGLKENSRAAAALMPNATVVEIPELHHGVFDVGVERLARGCREFFDA